MAELLEIVGLSEAAGRYPHQLSGGMQQRVALARALAVEPRVLLLDEPLSALDAKVRVGLREEIRRVQTDLGITTIFVTHDQEEALAISDRVAVLSKGRLEQVGTPPQIYGEPQTPFVAEFIGTMNRLRSTVVDGDRGLVEHRDLPFEVEAARGHRAGEGVMVLVRPESIELSRPADGVSEGPFDGPIVSHSFLGPVTRIKVESDVGVELTADVPSRSAGNLCVGDRVSARFDPAGPRVLALSRDDAEVIEGLQPSPPR